MVTHKASEVGSLLRRGVRELPAHATRAWERARALASSTRSRATQTISRRQGNRGQDIDPDSMTKDELLELARRADVTGRSSMTKAQLAAALRRQRET